MPTCREVTLLLDTLEAGRVPTVQRLAARFHLRWCDKCHRFADQHRATAEALRALATTPTTTGIEAFRAWRARG